MEEKKDKPRIVTHSRQCTICQKPIYTVIDHDYDDESKEYRSVKTENGYMCDFADDSGCFLDYHEECFDKHTCGAYPQKK